MSRSSCPHDPGELLLAVDYQLGFKSLVLFAFLVVEFITTTQFNL